MSRYLVTLIVAGSDLDLTPSWSSLDLAWCYSHLALIWPQFDSESPSIWCAFCNVLLSSDPITLEPFDWAALIGCTWQSHSPSPSSDWLRDTQCMKHTGVCPYVNIPVSNTQVIASLHNLSSHPSCSRQCHVVEVWTLLIMHVLWYTTQTCDFRRSSTGMRHVLWCGVGSFFIHSQARRPPEFISWATMKEEVIWDANDVSVAPCLNRPVDCVVFVAGVSNWNLAVQRHNPHNSHQCPDTLIVCAG